MALEFHMAARKRPHRHCSQESHARFWSKAGTVELKGYPGADIDGLDPLLAAVDGIKSLWAEGNVPHHFQADALCAESPRDWLVRCAEAGQVCRGFEGIVEDVVPF
jgi:hypothetical protein